MSHFAKVENGIVTQVIVAEQDVIDSGLFGTGWIQTSYNTHGGQHPENRPLRKNYASVGYIYDSQRDAFIPPKPYDSWLMDEQTCLWNSPRPMPTDGKKYLWNEPTTSWFEPEEIPSPTQNYPSWIAHVTSEWFSPPVAYPTDGKNYKWDEPTTSWIEVTNA